MACVARSPMKHIQSPKQITPRPVTREIDVQSATCVPKRQGCTDILVLCMPCVIAISSADRCAVSSVVGRARIFAAWFQSSECDVRPALFGMLWFSS